MSIASELTRLQNAKANIKSAIENNLGQTVPSSTTLEGYPNYIVAPIPSGCYSSKPTANGVYIKYVDGYSDYNVLWNGKTPVGVAIISSSSSFVIHPEESTGSWATSTQLVGCASAESYNNAITDFAGASNTQAIIASGIAGTGVTWATSRVFADGLSGYLPSAGQMRLMETNKNNINVAMNLINGTAFHYGTSDLVWTSTEKQSAPREAWTTADKDTHTKTAVMTCRSIATI